MDEDRLNTIRERVERCRRLAAWTTDPRTAEALLQLADEGEAELRQLEAEAGGSDKPPMPPTPTPNAG